jgi:NAD(P)-dependent dehydrogenase (short-subunit alcohol dehydrogenase family)
MPGWNAADIPDQTGRTVVVTGANSGLGIRSAEALAAKGALVVLACRRPERASAAQEHVAAVAAGPAPELVTLDLASLGSIREAAAVVTERWPAIDLLLNNAGIMAVPRGATADGFELQLGTNHLGHFALTGLLLPALLRAAAARVVTVSSNAHKLGRVDVDDLFFERARYARWRAYGQSKLANLLFSGELQRRAAAAGTGLLSVAAHPGYAATNLTEGPAIGAAALRPVLRLGDRVAGQPDHMGALPQLYAATMPDVRPDDYWGPDGVREMRGHPTRVGRTRRAQDTETARRLWERSEELTGVTYAWPA